MNGNVYNIDSKRKRSYTTTKQEDKTMKHTVKIMDYRNRLFSADLFAGVVLEEDLDPDCDYTWSAAGEDWADKFREELNGYIADPN